MKSITRFTKNIRGNECLNCGTHISEEDNFCPKCGQVNDTNRLSVKQYFSEYLAGFYSFDNRFLKTVIPLIFKPGFVTKKYIEGNRIKYVNPFQLYLHITILFFLIVGIFKSFDRFKIKEDPGKTVVEKLNPAKGAAALDSIRAETIKELQESDIVIDSATISLIDNSIGAVGINRDSIKKPPDQMPYKKELIVKFTDSVIHKADAVQLFKSDVTNKSERDSVMAGIIHAVDDKADSLLIVGEDLMIEEWSQITDGWNEISKKNVLKKVAANYIDSIFNVNEIDYVVPADIMRRAEINDSDGRFKKVFKKMKSFMDYQKDRPHAGALESLTELGYDTSYFNVFLFTKSKELNNAVEDPENFGTEMIDRIISRISVALFFLLPIFTLIVSLLYIRGKYNYTENLVFVFHVQTVFFILLLVFISIGRIFNSDSVNLIFMITFLIYLYLALRKFYGQGHLKTLVKYFILNSAFIVLAVIGGVIISFLAFLI